MPFILHLMVYRVRRKEKNITGEIRLSGSKSIANRILIIEALSGTTFEKKNMPGANDTILLQRLLRSSSPEYDAMDAGTTFRFLTAYLALKEGAWFLTGTERMKQRPIGELVDALRSLGAEITYAERENFPPLKIHGGKLTGNHVRISASVSSQFVSALLLIAPRMKNGLTIELTGEVVSAPYIEMTLSLMKYFGAAHERKGNTIHIPFQAYQPRPIFIESDWSAASYYYEIAALSNEADIILHGLLNDSVQGDAVIASIMKSWGIETSFLEEKIRIIKTNSLSPQSPPHFDLRNYPDLALALFATAAGFSQTVSFSGLEHLAYKESHREKAMRTELAKCGINVKNENGLITVSGNFNGSSPKFSTYDDHRMAMALTPLCLVCDEVQITDPAVVKKSYPAYWHDLISLGFEISEE